MSRIIASTQITLMDLNDAIITGTAPSSPTDGTLWIDTSANPNILKKWNDTTKQWVVQSLDLANLDPTADTAINTATQKLSDMANDSIVTQSERISIKDTIAQIIGYVPTDAQTLPTYPTLDSGGKGEFWSVRKAAITAGVSITDSNYTVFATNYTTLANYLNGLTPKPWDVSSTGNITITSATWRTNWYNYYDAMQKLQQFTVAIAQLYTQSRGENLVTNGTGLLGNNTNFSAFTFDGSDSYYCKGSFKDSAYNVTKFNDEFIPIDISQVYKLSVWAKTNPYVGAHYYVGVAEFDCDGNSISSTNHMYFANTLTTLAQDLKPGDTVIKLTNATGWQNSAGASTHYRSMIVWAYKNASGYLYPPETYSRLYYGYDLWSDGGVDLPTNTITLKTAWVGPTYLAGTQVSNGSAGGTYKYVAANYATIPSDWTNYTGNIGGIDTTGTNDATKFSYGTASIKMLFLNNRDVTGSTVWYSNITFCVDVASQGQVNGLADQINLVTTEYNAAIDVKADEINLSVDQKISDSQGSMQSYTDTKVNATVDSFNVRFDSIDTTTTQNGNDIAEIQSYFDFSADGLNIGKSDSPLNINISNEQMDFIDNGNVVAYINGQKMYINSLEVLSSIIVGNHKIEKYDNNITLVKWVGG